MTKKLVRLYPVPGRYLHPYPAIATDVEPDQVDELVESGAFTRDKPDDLEPESPETEEESQ